MTDEFVGRKEFDTLKEEVNAIKKDMVESQKLLQAIDKKIDVIGEKIISNDKVEDLKLQPIKDRVTKLENNQTWLRRSLLGELFALISTVIGFVLSQVIK